MTIAGWNGATGKNYFPMDFISPTVTIPAACRNVKFSLVTSSSIATGTQVYIPSNSHAELPWYIGKDWTNPTVSPSSASGEIIFSACDKGPITVANPSYMTVKKCVDIGKMVFDKRSQHIYLWKCARTNASNGTCLSRPSF